MIPSQEDALYEFLENATEPFTLENVTHFVRMIVSQKTPHLSSEIAALINIRKAAFPLGANRWISRRGYFEPLRFAINPSRLELLNGILIPGHRCVPFANPMLMPQEYVFYWRRHLVPVTTTEGTPDDFYPYYTIFGEEYAPQYVARDNPENEAAFNSDPYEDPSDVSIHTLDMRNIYRETSFVPGDRFVVRTLDWKAGIFELERVGKEEWDPSDIDAWVEAAETGFEDSFRNLGPGASTDEQLAFAYWYGGKRMRDVPALSLEDFLYEKTDRIETVSYGIETRFWYAGRDIPDCKTLEGPQAIPDRTAIEELLYRYEIPISEYVVQSYARDALYRNDPDNSRLVERIAPPTVSMDKRSRDILAEYAADIYEEFSETYNMFTDNAMGSIRQRVGELHTAVIDLVARLRNGGIELSWLPKHTFVVLSQIQCHAAGLMEELDMEDGPSADELEFMDNSLDSMIETYEDMKELIEEALNSFRRSNISVVKFGKRSRLGAMWWTLQLGLGGTDVWRRIILPENYSLTKLHGIIQILFEWNESFSYQFTGDDEALDLKTDLETLNRRNFGEILYEYGAYWTVKIMFLARQEAGEEERIRCVSGAGAAPPIFIDGPLRFKKFISALERGDKKELHLVQEKMGAEFNPDEFDIERCNRRLESRLFTKSQRRDLV
ncbi:MAG: plasmid pRiA4b ORF-3 family protein [Treponema sp.]|jgi:hypothetical protein|nr:plasmid pRiA4b ORF-3 family protein [Treponema sp.]